MSKNARTGLLLAAIALAFFVAVIAQQVWVGSAVG
ncbi:cytochrome oxidase small assembly protein [Andreprevotia chitinilytica]|nr:cytochrome oxidase small assembly protein [Andreprevotia chitinilytica]